MYEELSPARKPYADFNGSVVITASVMASIGNGDTLRQQVIDAGGSGDFAVEQEEGSPMLLIDANAGTQRRRSPRCPRRGRAHSASNSPLGRRFAVPDEDRIVLEDVLLPERASKLREQNRNPPDHHRDRRWTCRRRRRSPDRREHRSGSCP